MRNSQVLLASGATTANITGAALDVNQIVSASVTFETADATAAGTLKLQCCNTVLTNGGDRKNFVPTIWSDIPNATTTVTAGAAPAIVIGNMCFSYIRAVFTRSAGAGTANICINVLSC